MNVLRLLFVCISFCSASLDDEFKLPSYVDVCYRDDPKVADCLKKDIEKLIPKLRAANCGKKKRPAPVIARFLMAIYTESIFDMNHSLKSIGSEDFDLASLDPMVFKNLVFDYKSPIVGGHLELPEISTEGLNKLKVTSIKPKLKNPDKFVLDFVGHIPIINLKGIYNLTGNLITVPVRINGLFDFVLEEVDLAYHVTGDVKTIGEYDYLDLKTFNFRLKGEGIKSAYVAGTKLVEDRPALNRAVTTALNNNWRILRDNMIPVLYPVTDRLMRDLFKNFFRKYPYDVLFPRRTRVSLAGSNHTQPLR